MKRAVLIMAVVTLCVAGSAVADGGLIGSGTRSEASGQILGSGNAAGQMVGSGGVTMTTQDQWMGNGGRSGDGGQTVGSGGIIMTTQDQYLGSGGRSGDGGQILGSGGFTASSDDSRQVLGSGMRQQMGGGYFGSGLAVREIRLVDGSSLLMVSWGEETFVIAIEQ